jgi:hypothetical protein
MCSSSLLALMENLPMLLISNIQQVQASVLDSTCLRSIQLNRVQILSIGKSKLQMIVSQEVYLLGIAKMC